MNDSINRQGTNKPRKHSKKIRTIVLALVLATGVGATVAWATAAQFGSGHWGDPDRFEHGISRMAKYLDLDEAQRETIDGIVASSRAQAQPYRTELATLPTDMRALLETDVFYEDQVRVLLQSRAAAMLELSVIGARTMHEIRAELTPEQRAEADALMERFRERGGRHGNRRQRHKNDTTEPS